MYWLPPVEVLLVCTRREAISQATVSFTRAAKRKRTRFSADWLCLLTAASGVVAMLYGISSRCVSMADASCGLQQLLRIGVNTVLQEQFRSCDQKFESANAGRVFSGCSGRHDEAAAAVRRAVSIAIHQRCLQLEVYLRLRAALQRHLRWYIPIRAVARDGDFSSGGAGHGNKRCGREKSMFHFFSSVYFKVSTKTKTPLWIQVVFLINTLFWQV